MFSITFSNNALKDLRKLEPKMKARLHELFAVLSIEPVPRNSYDVLKLSGSDHHYRIRLGRYRLQYSVDWEQKKIKILEFERRDEHTYG